MDTAQWIILGAVVVGIVVALFGWDRYRGSRKGASHSDTSRPTDEVFVDPETGRRTRVWYDPSTGKRDYRPE